MKALVIGANGQDGTFLVRHLLKRNHRVLGIGRQESSRCGPDSPLFEYRQVDLANDGAFGDLLALFEPELTFHFAAVHASAGGRYEPRFRDLLKVNVASVHVVLEYLRAKQKGALVYASSAKVFGSPLPPRISEESRLHNQCLYSLSKNTSFHLIDYYRTQHRVMASVLYLFNHESELRPANFFIPKILACLDGAIRDRSHTAQIDTLDFFCDWGSAEEYMSIVVDVLERAPSQDFVLGTGICTHARSLVEQLFGDHGLDYRDHMVEARVVGHAAGVPYQVDLTKLKQHVGRTPNVSIHEVCRLIVKAKASGPYSDGLRG